MNSRRNDRPITNLRKVIPTKETKVDDRNNTYKITVS
jgi:hypothetical protein